MQAGPLLAGVRATEAPVGSGCVSGLMERVHEGSSPRTPADMILHAIGDIHGRRDLLDRAIATIDEAGGPARRIVIFLGDYIDRGPDSRGVIERLIRLRETSRDELVFLRGNHEQILLDVVDGDDSGLRWLEHGGRETMASYGVQLTSRDTGEALR